jgi:hypothetical protein
MAVWDLGMELRQKFSSEVTAGAGKYFSALARVMYAPPEEILIEVEAARARIKLLGVQHWPPQTDDENLVSAYDAITNGTQH